MGIDLQQGPHARLTAFPLPPARLCAADHRRRLQGNEQLVDDLTTVCLEGCSHWAPEDK